MLLLFSLVIYLAASIIEKNEEIPEEFTTELVHDVDGDDCNFTLSDSWWFASYSQASELYFFSFFIQKIRISDIGLTNLVNTNELVEVQHVRLFYKAKTGHSSSEIEPPIS